MHTLLVGSSIFIFAGFVSAAINKALIWFYYRLQDPVKMTPYKRFWFIHALKERKK